MYTFYEIFTIKYYYVTGKQPHISPLRCGIIISGGAEGIAFTNVFFCWLLGYMTFCVGTVLRLRIGEFHFKNSHMIITLNHIITRSHGR